MKLQGQNSKRLLRENSWDACKGLLNPNESHLNFT